MPEDESSTQKKKGLIIKGKSNGLKMLNPNGVEQHQLKIVKPKAKGLTIKNPPEYAPKALPQENSTHYDNLQTHVQPTPPELQPYNEEATNQPTLKPQEEDFDPLATYVQHQETLFDMEEQKRKAIVEQEEKLRKLEEEQERRLKELENRLEQERKRLQEEKLRFAHAKQASVEEIEKDEEFLKEHEKEDEERWIDFEEKSNQEKALLEELEQIEKDQVDPNEDSHSEVDPDPARQVNNEEDQHDDAPIIMTNNSQLDSGTYKAKTPEKEVETCVQKELIKHTVNEERDKLIEMAIEQENVPDTFSEEDSVIIEAKKKTGDFTPSFYVIDAKGIHITPIEDDDVIFNFGKSKDADCLVQDPSISETQMRAVHFKGRWTFMDTGTRDALSFNGIKTRQLTTTSEARTAIKCGNSWVIHVGLDSDRYDETDTQILQKSILNNIPEPYVDEASVTISYGSKAQSSTMAPILVGSHAACDFKQKDLKPFHFIIYWSQVGLFIEDLTKGHPGVFLGDQRISGNTGINDTISITAGKKRFDVVVNGSLDLHRQALANSHNT